MSQDPMTQWPQKPEAVTFDDALAAIRGVVDVLPDETVPLVDALGRILAQEVRAACDYPAFDMSAMDGYAFRSSETMDATPPVPLSFAIAGSAFAGDQEECHAGPGEVLAISTGAPMPSGYDAVVPRERCEIVEVAGYPMVSIADPVASLSNVRRRGEDARRDERVADANEQVTPAMIGAFACYGIAELRVRRRPAVSILTTGNELSSRPEDIRGMVQDGNGPMLIASCRSAGLSVESARKVGDEVDAINAAFDAIIAGDSPDIILTTGGVSVGTRDLIPEVLASRGASVEFHGVRMRPGKPVLFARLAGGQLVFGLPGNPVAALLGFRFFVMEAVRAMLGLEKEQGVPVVDAREAARPGATVFSKALASYSADGTLVVEKLPGQQSHLMRPLIRANAWLLTPPSSKPPGSTILYPLFPRI